MQNTDHWEDVYRNKRFDAVSWYAPHLGESLRFIEQLCPDKTAAIVDIGGGDPPWWMICCSAITWMSRCWTSQQRPLISNAWARKLSK